MLEKKNSIRNVELRIKLRITVMKMPKKKNVFFIHIVIEKVLLKLSKDNVEIGQKTAEHASPSKNNVQVMLNCKKNLKNI